MLSVDRGAMRTADEACRHARSQGRKSDGSCSVLIGECNDMQLQAYEDPIPENSAHAVIDQSHLKRGEREKAAKQLIRYARWFPLEG